MKLHYHIYLLERFSSINIIRIQEFIEEFLKLKSIKDVSNQITEGEIIYFVQMEVIIFEELASKVLHQFNYELSEYTMILYNHYHIERYTDDYNIIHAVTAYQVSENVWEFYYDDGILDVTEKTGTVEGETRYLYKLELDSSQDNQENALEKSFDNWLKTLV